MLPFVDAGVAFAGIIALQKQTTTTEKMEDRGFIHEYLVIPAGLLPRRSASVSSRMTKRYDLPTIAIFFQRGVGRGGGDGRDLGVGVALGLGVGFGVGVGVGVTAGPSCTSNEPMSMRLFLRR